MAMRTRRGQRGWRWRRTGRTRRQPEAAKRRTSVSDTLELRSVLAKGQKQNVPLCSIGQDRRWSLQHRCRCQHRYFYLPTLLSHTQQCYIQYRLCCMNQEQRPFLTTLLQDAGLASAISYPGSALSTGVPLLSTLLLGPAASKARACRPRARYLHSPSCRGALADAREPPQI